MTTTLLNCEVSNPKLGDIVPARLLGIKDRNGSRIWAECELCGKERWVVCKKRLPEAKFCKKCSDSKRPLRKNGRYLSDGYVWVLAHPADRYYCMANHNGYIAEHRLVMAKSIHRALEAYEIVHHKNHIRDDNRLENLSLLSGKSEHFVDIKLYQYIQELENENQRLRGLLKCQQLS